MELGFEWKAEWVFKKPNLVVTIVCTALPAFSKGSSDSEPVLGSVRGKSTFWMVST